MRHRVIGTIIATALLLVAGAFAAPSASAATTPPSESWYVCRTTGTLPLQAWGASGAPYVAHVPAGVQFRGYAFGNGSYMVITEGGYKGMYAPTASLCKTSALGVGKQWQSRAQARYNRALALDTGNMRPDFNARMAYGRALMTSWDDPVARAYLKKVLAAEDGNGGFGIGYAWDAMGDGSVNPADTAYTVTISEHVGRMALSAYRAGAIDGDLIERMIARLQSFPTVSRDRDCIAYSETSYDAAAGYCVYNVNTSAGTFLLAAKDAGFEVDEAKAQRFISHSLVAHDVTRKQWRYISGSLTKWNDSDHNAFQTIRMHDVHPTFARPIIAHMNSRTLPNRSGEAHTVLAQVDCAGSLKWLSEHDTRFGVDFKNNADRQAYGFLMAQLAAVSCG